MGKQVKCDSYRTRTRTKFLCSPATGRPIISHNHYIGFCDATCERDECDCGGDRAKCTFYPEYRAQEGGAQFSCRRNRYGKYIVCENCSAPCFVNRLIWNAKAIRKIEKVGSMMAKPPIKEESVERK